MDVVGMYRCVTGTTENQVIHYLKTTTTKVNKMQEVLPAGNKPNTSHPFPVDSDVNTDLMLIMRTLITVLSFGLNLIL